MKLSLSIFATLAAVAHSGPAVCQEQCESLPGVLTQLNQQLEPDNKAGNFLSAFKYGKYCGARNSVREPGGLGLGLDTSSCNPIDEACKGHDACYSDPDVSISGEPTPAKCKCNSVFIQALFAGRALDDCTGELCYSEGRCPYTENAENILCLFCGIYLTDLQIVDGCFDPVAYSICLGPFAGNGGSPGYIIGASDACELGV
jgi:hypothetical protein